MRFYKVTFTFTKLITLFVAITITGCINDIDVKIKDGSRIASGAASSALAQTTSVAIANGSDTIDLTIKLANSAGTPLVGVTPIIDVSGSGNTIAQTCTPTNSNGISTCANAIQSTEEGVKTISIVSPIAMSGGSIVFYKTSVISTVSDTGTDHFTSLSSWESIRGGDLVNRKLNHVENVSNAFTNGETITGQSSGCTGIYIARNSSGVVTNFLDLDSFTGTCLEGETLTGGTSASTLTFKSLLATGTIEIAELKRAIGVGNSYDERILIDGNTVDSSHYMHIKVASGEEHLGLAGTGVVFNPSTDGHVITINSDYTIIDGVEITGWPISVNGASFEGIRVHGDNILLENLIVHAEDLGGGVTNPNSDGIHIESSLNTTLTLTIRNSFVYDIQRGAINYQGADAITVIIDNVSICNTGQVGADSQGGINNSSATATFIVTNTISILTDTSGADNYNGTFSGLSSNNISEDGSAPGSSVTTGVSNSTQFISTTMSSENLHLQGGSDAVNSGIDRTFTNDIDGNTRASGSFDVGADEF